MKVILSNFLSVLKRFKLATTLNLIGLSVGFITFIILMMQVGYELGFDRCHPKADSIYRLDLPASDKTWIIASRPFIDAFIASSPHIKEGTLLCPFIGETYFVIDKQGDHAGFREKIMTCYPSITKIFGFDMKEGDAGCLSDPEKVLIPASLASKLFGESSAVGKKLKAEESIYSKQRRDFVVGGVYTDFPGNTQLENVIYTAVSADFALQEWKNQQFVCYVLLDSPGSAEQVVQNFDKNFNPALMGWDKMESHRLTPLTATYFDQQAGMDGASRTGNRKITHVLILIAFLIIVVAAINFTNLSTSLIPLRIRSINTRKLFGSSDRVLRIVLLAEAVGLCLVSYLIAIFAVYALNESSWLSFIEADLSLLQHIPLLIGTGVLAVVAGLIAGCYPAYYAVSFPPALVIKGSFGLSPAGRKLRTALIGFQFIVSALLVIVALFIRLQNQYLVGYPVGFDKENIAVVQLSSAMYEEHKDTYVSKLKAWPGISEVAFSEQKVGASDSYPNWVGGLGTNKMVQYFAIPVSANFLSVMNIPLLEGRDANRTDEQNGEVYIFNKKAQELYGMKADDRLNGFWGERPVVGISGNIALTSLRSDMPPMAFVYGLKGWSMPVSYIKIRPDVNIRDAAEHIRKCVAEIDPSYPFELEFYDKVLDHLYKKEQNMSRIISLFSLLTVLISIVGVSGLVLFDSQCRRKEIGIRKVHGASVADILKMFNWLYVRIMVVGFILAVPVAYYCVIKWLEGFAYKTPIYGWVFVVAFLVITFITLSTVTIQNWKTAIENPVNSIKTE